MSGLLQNHLNINEFTIDTMIACMIAISNCTRNPSILDFITFPFWIVSSSLYL